MSSMSSLRQSIRSRLRPVGTATAQVLIRRLVNERTGCVPLERAIRLRKVLRWTDALMPEPDVSSGNRVSHAGLARHLGEQAIGEWSLPAESIDYLRAHVIRHAPEVILEFGSGVSTLALATFAQELHGTGAVRVFSIDQDQEFLHRTQVALDDAGLGDLVRLQHVPVIRRQVLGHEVPSYDLTSGLLDRFLGGCRPDLVLVDGPAAGDLGRLSTVPLVLDRLPPGAWVFLDDALRDSEMQTAELWADWGRLDIRGIELIGHGLLVSRVR